MLAVGHTTQGDRIRRGVRLAGLPALWVGTALGMVNDSLHDPYVATRLGTAAYHHNQEGALLQGLGMTLVELVVLALILRPWSYRRSWGRSAVALVVILPWTLLWAGLMHQGGVLVVHAMWLVSLVVILCACCAWSGFAALRARRYTTEGAP